MRAILLDLDDTLVPDHSDFLAAVDDTAAAVGAPAGMSAAVRVRAQQRWQGAAAETRLRMTDISSWESLWAPFPADLRSWADGHRLDVWRAALRDCGVDDIGLARRLSESYRECRLERCSPYPEVVGVLENLRGFARLGVVTNGVEEHQRAKLAAAGLTDHFDVVVSSSVVGASKPDPRIFRFALERLGGRAADAVMVGDNPARDIAGGPAGRDPRRLGRPQRRRRLRCRPRRAGQRSGWACGAGMVVDRSVQMVDRYLSRARSRDGVGWCGGWWSCGCEPSSRCVVGRRSTISASRSLFREQCSVY
jgi:HAD superfamily hydrolase (TIGR01549 family)